MELKNIIVIGAGTMGQGIAQWFLQQNCIVELIDLNSELLSKSMNQIGTNLDQLVAKNKLSLENALLFKKNLHSRNYETMNPKADLVIEAIIENLEIKKDLFKKLDTLMSSDTIFASNTSSFPITNLSSSISDQRKKNFLGLHFFNPATIMKLVEVINGKETSSTLAQNLVEWFNQKGKVACLCSDSPGFIVNRVARNYYGESLRAVETYNLEKIKEVDTVLKSVGGFKMGPFELMDLIGIDVNLSVTESIYHAFFDEPRFKPHRLQKEMVDAKRLGKKTQKGFYEY
jgi:3-hydroxybutyryl-CoA dehydrogenase